jgi:hypothetical protein
VLPAHFLFRDEARIAGCTRGAAVVDNKFEETTMMHSMNDMGWMMGGMGLVWFLFLVVLVLGILALFKYLRSGD